MNDNSNCKIIVCETCYKIPKLEIINQNEIKLECSTCGTQIKNIAYFNKFKSNINDELNNMPKCNFINNNHEANSILYCFQCSKYLCENCIKTHNISFERYNHLLINQRIKNNYYCNKDGHKDFILYKYCTLCRNYLCSQFHCNHDNANFFNFENAQNTQIINEIINKVKQCENIVINEENNFKKFLKEINKKIEIIKNIFNDYKERNLKIILFYKLLIHNYNKINKIRNYNIINNIILNSNFDLSNSDRIIKEEADNNNECLSSIYNRLFAFYNNKFHINLVDPKIIK